MTARRKIGYLELTLNGNIHKIDVIKENGHWNYIRSNKQTLYKKSDKSPQEMLRALKIACKVKGIEGKITYHPYHTQNEKRVPEKILGSI